MSEEIVETGGRYGEYGCRLECVFVGKIVFDTFDVYLGGRNVEHFLCGVDIAAEHA